MPHVSIITPAYEAAATIADTILSVQAQRFTDWEMIIVDDCSSDGTGTVVERFATDDPRIRLIRRATNGGSATARNQGIDVANGRYLAFLDADDLWLPEKLAMQLEFMQTNNAALSYHGYRRLHGDEGLGRVLRGPERVTFDTLLRKNCVAALTMMIDRERTGPVKFPEDVRRREDLALWLQLTKAGHDILFLNQDLARYRVMPGHAIVRGQIANWNIYRRFGGLTIRQSFGTAATNGLHGVWKRLF